MNRKQLLGAGLALAAALVGATGAQAQSAAWPAKPITIIIPFAPGGSSDILARLFAEKMSAELGQPVLVENRSGGDGVIGAQAAARARPDGYTLVQLSPAHVILPSMRKDMPYDWKRDFTPVFGPNGVPIALAVSGKSNIRSLADLAATANAMGGKINYASGGTGSLNQLLSALVVQSLKLPGAVHVPYRGLSPAMQAVLGDQAQFSSLNVPDVIELVKAGTLRLLAVTSEQRLPYLPNVPTFKELGYPELVGTSWTVVMTPANTPPEVVERLQQALTKAVNDPALKERLDKMGVMLGMKNKEDLGRFMNDEAARWRKVVEDNQFKLEN